MQQQQQAHHPMQTLIGGGFPPIASVTTEIVQKYLDENKQLILAILDNQNLGKLNECATFQAKLQANLMYLAAVADSQPQSTPVHAQVPPTAVMQPGMQYMSHPQVQQQMAQQSFMVGRGPLQYTPQQMSALHQAQQQLQQQQQQAMHGQHGIHTGGSNNLQLHPTDSGMTVNSSMPSRGFAELGRGGITEGMHMSRGLNAEIRIGGRSDMMSVSDVGHSAASNGNGGSGGQVADEQGPTYLKSVDEERN